MARRSSTRVLQTAGLLALAAVVTVSALSPALAQSSSAIGTPTESRGGLSELASYSSDKVETVNLANGNLNLQIPIVMVGGRGSASYTLALSYNSKLWGGMRNIPEPCEGGSSLAARFAVGFNDNVGFSPDKLNLGAGWSISKGPSIRIIRMNLDQLNANPPAYQYALTKVFLTLPDGSEIQMRDDQTDGGPLTTQSNFINDGNRGRAWHSTDGSAITYVTDAANGVVAGQLAGYVYLADGTRLQMEGVRLQGETKDSSARCKRIIDPNGNFIDFAYNSGNVTYTDQLGRQVILNTNPITGTKNYKITIIGYGIASRDIIIERDWLMPLDAAGTAPNLRQDFQSVQRPVVSGDYQALHCSFGEQQHALFPGPHTDLFPSSDIDSGFINMGDVEVVTRLNLLDGRHFKFRYNQFGEVAEIEYPAGGKTEIDYDGFLSQNMCEAGGANRGILDRRVTRRRSLSDGATVDGVWTYARATQAVFGTTTPTYPVVKVEARQGSATGTLLMSEVHFFIKLGAEYRACPINGLSKGTGYEHWDNAKEFRVERQSGSGLQIEKREWAQRAQVNWGSSTYVQEYGQEQPPNDPRVSTEDTILENGKMKRVRYDYSADKFNNVTMIREYDFGNTSGSEGTLLRKTVRTYVTSLNGYCYTNLSGLDNSCGTSVIASPSSIIHRRRLLLTEEVRNGSDVVESRTEYGYDNYDPTNTNHASLTTYASPPIIKNDRSWFNPTFDQRFEPRGNVTKVRAWISGSTSNGLYTSSYNQYDVAGNVVKALNDKEPGITTSTTLSYTDNYGDGTNPDTGAEGTNGATYAAVTRATNHMGHIVKMQHNYSRGVTTGVKDANGVITKTEYNDNFDRPTRVTAALGEPESSITEMSYPTASANESKVSKQLDSSRWLTSKTALDGFGRPVIASQAEDGFKFDNPSVVYSIHSTTIYDGVGRAWKVSNPYRGAPASTDGWTRTSFDLAGRVIEVASFGGDQQTPPPDTGTGGTAYSGSVITTHSSEQTTVRDQAGKQRRSTVDGLGRLVKIDEMQQHPSSTVYSTTNYSYDARENLIQVNQSTSPTQTRRFAYDGLSRLIRASNPEQVSSSNATFTLNGQSWAVRYDYDLASNLTAKTDTRPAGSGFVTASNIYDNLNRISTRSYNDGTPTVTYSYDTATRGIGQVRSVITIGVSTYNYTTYDALGRLTHYNQETDGQTYSLSAAYNKAGLMTSETYPSNRIVATEYDSAGRIAGVRNQSTGQYYAGASASDATNRLQYTAHGAVSRMKLGNGLWEHTNFNPRLQPTRIGLGTTGTSTSLLGLDYDYGATNNNGNLLTQTINAPGLSATQGYTYDNLNRLLTAQESVGGVRWAQTFGYDQFGNRISLINTGVDAPSLPPPQAHPVNASTNRFTNFTYDAAGNLRADHAGNTFSYDAESKQITSSVAGTQAAYSYDGEGRRVKKVAGGVATIFVYNASGQLVAEYGGAASGESGASYLTTDHLGSTRVVTNGSGGVRARHDYLPFGEEIPANVGGRQNVPGYTANDSTRQRFTGYERDSESGLDFAQARYCSSALGRFTSPDPLISSAKQNDPQSWNRYIYVGNRPLNYIDPSGLDWIQHKNDSDVVNGYKWIEGNEVSKEDSQNGWDLVPGGGVGLTYTSKENRLIKLGENGNWSDLGYVGPEINIWSGPGTDILGESLIFMASNAAGEIAGFGVLYGISRLGATLGKTVTHTAPSKLARVIPGEGNFTTLGRPTVDDVFVTAADDIAGLDAKQLAHKITIPESKVFTVIEFPTPRYGLASPVNRTNPGFVGFGKTAGGAREFVVPNGPIPANAVTRVVQ
jgi:RHS repeat-associated protein